MFVDDAILACHGIGLMRRLIQSVALVGNLLFLMGDVLEAQPEPASLRVEIPVVGGASESWRYVKEAPPPRWQHPAFNDARWMSGSAPFGATEDNRTRWSGPGIWLRRPFSFYPAPGELVLRMRVENSCTVFLNGRELAHLDEGDDEVFEEVPLRAGQEKLLRPLNVMAVHGVRENGTAVLDVELVLRRELPALQLVSRNAIWARNTDAKQAKPDWAKPGFSASGWTKKKGGFGNKQRLGFEKETIWRAQQIWLRHTFELPVAPATPKHLVAEVFHDGDVEIFLNGISAGRRLGASRRYVLLPLSDSARNSVGPGRNVLAVHTVAAGTDRAVDVALYGLASDKALDAALQAPSRLIAPREWTPKKGSPFEAELLGIAGRKVLLRFPDGRQRSAGVTEFAAEDQAYVTSQRDRFSGQPDRVWNTPGAKQMRGRLSHADGDLVVIVRERDRKAIPMRRRHLSEADQSYLEQLETGAGALVDSVATVAKPAPQATPSPPPQASARHRSLRVHVPRSVRGTPAALGSAMVLVDGRGLASAVADGAAPPSTWPSHSREIKGMYVSTPGLVDEQYVVLRLKEPISPTALVVWPYATRFDPDKGLKRFDVYVNTKAGKEALPAIRSTWKKVAGDVELAIVPEESEVVPPQRLNLIPSEGVQEIAIDFRGTHFGVREGDVGLSEILVLGGR